MFYSILVGLIASALLGASFLLWIYLALRMFASRGKFFTEIKQDRIHFVMVGGTAHRCLANLRAQGKWVHPHNGEIWKVEFDAKGKNILKGKKLDWENRAAELEPIKNSDLQKLMNGGNRILRFLEREFGWYFMSWNPDAKLWKGMFSHYQVKGLSDANASGDKKPLDFEYRQEETDALFPSGIYGIEVNVKTGLEKDKPAETIPVHLSFAVEVEVTNAMVAQFKVPNNPYFITPLVTNVESAAVGIAGQMTYDELTAEPTESDKSRWFSGIITELNGDKLKGNPSIILSNGVMLTAIHLREQKITDKTIAEAATKYYTAKRDAEAAIEAARGKKEATLLENEALANTIEKVEKARQTLAIELMKARRDNDPEGRFALAEALGKTGIKYWGGGAGPIPLLNLDDDKK